MRFNYLKELLSSALVCALCVNANESRCPDVSLRCAANSNGQITELELKNNAVFDAKYFSTLTSIEKLTISGEQKYIQQSHFNEIATSTTLKELHLTYNSASITNIDMTVVKKISSLTYLEVSESCAKHINFNEMTNIKELDVSKVSLDQKMVNDIVKMPKLGKMHLCLDNKFNKLDIKGLKSKKTLTSIEFNSKERSSAKYINFKNSFKGFTYIKELNLNYVKLTETDIKDISGLNQIQTISCGNCNFSSASIEPLDKLANLQNFKLKEAKDIKGGTLTNKSLVKAEYGISSSSSNNFCMKSNSRGIKDAHRKLLKPCSGASAASVGAFHNAHASTASVGAFHNAHAAAAAMKNTKNAALCGPRKGKCPPGQCCSKDGKCGIGMKFCGINCLPKYGKCNHK